MRQLVQKMRPTAKALKRSQGEVVVDGDRAPPDGVLSLPGGEQAEWPPATGGDETTARASREEREQRECQDGGPRESRTHPCRRADCTLLARNAPSIVPVGALQKRPAGTSSTPRTHRRPGSRIFGTRGQILSFKLLYALSVCCTDKEPLIHGDREPALAGCMKAPYSQTTSRRTFMSCPWGWLLRKGRLM